MFNRLFGKTVFGKPLFGKAQAPSRVLAPEILGLHLGGSFSLDELKLRLLAPELVSENMSSVHIIQAVGEVRLDESSKVLRFYTDDDGFLQVVLDGGDSDEHVTDVKLYYFYETQGIGSDADWEKVLKETISQPQAVLEAHQYTQVWQGVGESSPPVAMTETTHHADGSVSSTDQFAMLYERKLYEGKLDERTLGERSLGERKQDETAPSGSEVGGEKFEYLMKIGEEKMNNGQLDRCLVVSTGFDIEPSDISFN
ncbi:YjfK family protein [Halomonas binhaiensis]|uniref:YjfK family protein n=1 Tax=Halomonas binhaiensis TaxID=2562282 RepID=A0A5C1NFA0_9GAMM|nr:YjfK family protein [Halomonas binhaiensis]QEM81541.1 YjfK family protein [Halomonas binhaiensis]